MNRDILMVISLFVISITLCACGDLTRLPKDEVSSDVYWQNSKQIQQYVNQFYPNFKTISGWGGGPYFEDWNSDNMVGIWSSPGQPNPRISGLITINSEEAEWERWYEEIREVNYMLVNARKNRTLSEESNRFMGEARFFRAYFYFQLLKNYGGIPWISKPLNTESSELYSARTQRNQVVDSILVDLDYSIEHLPPKSQTGGNRLNKESALLFKSRVALFEGTWEKYHQDTPFGVKGENGRQYFETAAEAAKRLIDMGTAEIYSTGNPDIDYLNLFNQNDLDGNSEVFLWKKFDRSQDMSHNLQRWVNRNGAGTGVTKSLVDAYLVDNGKPIAVSDRYHGDETLKTVVTNRDPRLHQLIWVPGDVFKVDEDGSITNFDKPALNLSGNDQNTTGYQLKKGAAKNAAKIASFSSETASIVFRYAEVLLNYAEAKAELGDIIQQDLDMTVNKLRDRVDMPHLMLNESITSDPNWDYPDLSPIINEIRRERRVELACEGFRQDDIFRWAAADELIVGNRPLGAMFKQFNFPNMTVGENVYVNDAGYIDPLKKSLPSDWEFDTTQDYLLPIPPNQITLNDKLVQNPGW